MQKIQNPKQKNKNKTKNKNKLTMDLKLMLLFPETLTLDGDLYIFIAAIAKLHFRIISFFTTK